MPTKTSADDAIAVADATRSRRFTRAGVGELRSIRFGSSSGTNRDPLDETTIKIGQPLVHE